MRVGFFGGSFDPPHRGHVAVALAAAKRLRLDRVLMAPVGVQPLKRGSAHTPFADRLAMVRLACAVDGRLVASELDAPRADRRPNYTYDTLQQLGAALRPADRLFFLLGADSFATLRQWHRAPELLGMCSFVVAGRPGASLERIGEYLPEGIEATEVCGSAELVEYWLRGGAAEGKRLYVLPDLSYDVAATSLRTALASEGGGGAADLDAIDSDVMAYARSRGLYRRRS